MKKEDIARCDAQHFIQNKLFACADVVPNARKSANHSVKHAAMQNRRKLLPRDVVEATRSRSEFAFLRDDLKDLVAEQAAAAAESGSSKEGGKPATAAVAATASKGQRTLNDFFTQKKPTAANDDGATDQEQAP